MTKYLDLTKVIDVEPEVSEVLNLVDDEDLVEEVINRFDDIAEYLVEELDSNQINLLVSHIMSKK